VSLGAHGVIARRFWLGATVLALDDGASAAASFTAWLTKRIGLSAGISAGGGTFVGTHQSFTTAGGSIAVDAWVSRHFGLGVAYSPVWTSGGQMGTLAHLVVLGVSMRAR
jgi:hypothetical protein